MTRLHDALGRAGALPVGSGGLVGPGGPVEPVEPVEPFENDATARPLAPEAWRFDASSFEPAIEPGPGPEPEPDAKYSEADLPRHDRATTAAQYPFIGPEMADKVVVGAKVESVFVEQYRRLVASLHHAQLRGGVRTVMITSAVESEGKTLTAANVAFTLSHSYQRNVLLIDADLRRPSVHEVFHLDNQRGLGEVLGFEVREGKLPVKQISPNLWVMTAGRPNPDPMGGLVSDTMKQLLTEAAEKFDWVVVDTPPVALLTDANLLASMIDLALIVVSARSTPYPLVKRAVDAIGPAKVLGVVLNRADSSEASEALSYGYGYGGYGYSYSYGARKSEKPKRSWRFWGRRSA